MQSLKTALRTNPRFSLVYRMAHTARVDFRRLREMNTP